MAYMCVCVCVCCGYTVRWDKGDQSCVCAEVQCSHRSHPYLGTTLERVLLTWSFYPGSWELECKCGLGLYAVQLAYFLKS